MFKKIEKTTYLPQKPYLIWDGDCGFCKYWKKRWQKKTGDKIIFTTYQESASFFKDIPLKEFKKSSKLIEADGKVFNGPDSAYRALWHQGNKFWHRFYTQSSFFRFCSDHAYNHIAKNRSFYYKLTIGLFGKNPINSKPYWLFYLSIIICIIAYIFFK